MEWTKEKPTEPGYYWAKMPDCEIFMVSVEEDEKDGTLWFYEFGDNNARYDYEYVDEIEWQPVQPPTDQQRIGDRQGEGDHSRKQNSRCIYYLRGYTKIPKSLANN